VLIAKKTKSDNIAEHILYMFQIEDLIRANNLDVDTIYNSLLEPQIKDEKLLAEYKAWYVELIKRLKIEGIVKKGHLTELQELLMELLMLHDTLINVLKNKKYLQSFEAALPALKEFQQKSNDSNLNLIEVGFNALYGKIILNLQGKPVTEASEQGFKTISNLLAYLAAYYKKMKNGELDSTKN
jgi:hypothetical protein